MTDNEIEGHLLIAGHKPGTSITPQVLRAFVHSIARDAHDSLLEVRKKYVIRPGDRYDRQTAATSLIVTDNCLRALCEALGIRTPSAAQRDELLRTWFVLKEFGHHPGRTDDTLSECTRRALASNCTRSAPH